jgi:CheY-like chemotaxis protein
MPCQSVADDNDLRQTVRTILEADRVEVIEANSGARVQQMLKDNRVDLLLTDILMPGSDGVETNRGDTLARPRSEYHCDVRGAAQTHRISRWRLNWADAVLEKSFRPQQRRMLVAGVIAGRDTGSPPPQ